MILFSTPVIVYINAKNKNEYSHLVCKCVPHNPRTYRVRHLHVRVNILYRISRYGNSKRLQYKQSLSINRIGNN